MKQVKFQVQYPYPPGLSPCGGNGTKKNGLDGPLIIREAGMSLPQKKILPKLCESNNYHLIHIETLCIKISFLYFGNIHFIPEKKYNIQIKSCLK